MKVVPLEKNTQKRNGHVRASVAREGINAVFKIFSPQESSTFLSITKNKTHPHYTKYTSPLTIQPKMWYNTIVDSRYLLVVVVFNITDLFRLIVLPIMVVPRW